MLYMIDYTAKNDDDLISGRKWVNFVADATEATRRFMDWFFVAYPHQKVRVDSIVQVELIGDLSALDVIDAAIDEAKGKA